MKKKLSAVLAAVLLLALPLSFSSCYTPKNGFYVEDEGTRYYINDEYQTGWVDVNSVLYYFIPYNGYMVTEPRWIKNTIYGFNPDGTPANGMLAYNDIMRYFSNGIPDSGWQEIDGVMYYFHAPHATVASNPCWIDEKFYGFNPDGTPMTGFFTNKSGTRYFVEGNYLTGWQEIDGIKYYFTPSNGLMANTPRWIDNKKYGFDFDGRLARGFLSDSEGARFYVEGIPHTGWLEYKGDTYYFYPPHGVMATGDKSIDGVSYTFAQDGKLIKNGAGE